ncbi:ATP-dependent protease La [Caldibacillus debilis GB1]|uniref:ATP-dependent protease La n=1 Tax=Caldibacillus debilis GB1 TaxID=1339248 RepID=A0A420VJ29_9BACI|nr:ATP-dependent protease La [Caldibacillus debilis GB1]
MSSQQKTIVPLLPLRGILVFPATVLHLDVGREKSIQALERAMIGEHFIFLTTQKEVSIDDPTKDDMYPVGTLSKVKQMLKLPNGTIRVLVEGLKRGKIERFLKTDRYFEVEITTYENEGGHDLEEEALVRTVLDYFEQYIRLSKKISFETFTSIQDIDEPGRMADLIASHMPLKLKEKQELLETFDVKERLQRLVNILHNEKEVIQLERKIGQRVKKAMERTQKEYYLREQMKAIQKELGEKEGKFGEVEELREKIMKADMPEHVLNTALRELDRYEKMPSTSAESSVIRTYIDWLISLPWKKMTKDDLDLKKAERILNEDHYGLDKVKERVLEYLAVQKLTRSLKGPILCLVGPPGVGKTSLARSIARALNRHFVRISLGGVRDESEIRGHRRTYVGAMPGRIIQGMRKAGTVNPVFLLDEIDKMASDFRGDPAASLLEVLDPEQNKNFSDHYIEEPYDLSKVMFIATANNAAAIPEPLLDRMEVIAIPGYTEIEKLHIAKDYLLKKQLKEHGLTKGQLQNPRRRDPADHPLLYEGGGRPGIGAADRLHLPEDGQDHHRRREKAGRCHEEPGCRVFGQTPLPVRPRRTGRSGRGGDRPRLYGVRRRHAANRSLFGARKRQIGADGKARGRHEGVRPGRFELHPILGGKARCG